MTRFSNYRPSQLAASPLVLWGNAFKIRIQYENRLFNSPKGTLEHGRLDEGYVLILTEQILPLLK